ncbi:polysaccharide deacetylase family protein [Lacrimispora algidixylanolytica]|uniref:Peptidoglycan N-acetylglucosamine deacetylase n=1 Tax=Lacrimispora algidixylanolytica TaxID=94868 RepID=A0A419T1K6_9FIRM|nr:polysaccharide deacetylase family protein [Lacrimispora algidixylanolytica]RKD31444.1 peptidoglycan N-acetylglucosamine deacetylase [Lacrimispora algidixylanolytica]
MKMRWKVALFLAVFILDVLCMRAMYESYSKTKDTLFLPADAGGEARDDVKNQFSGSRQIALTFDDGPHSVYTSRLLDGLRQRGVHATFFLLGENVIGKEDIVKQMQEDGHLIGNHGYSHVQMSKESVNTACEQIEKNNEQIEKITGVRPQYLRPPYGAWTAELECTTNMTVVLWNKDPLDWKTQSSKKVVRNIIKHVEPGDVILMHDVYPTSVEAALEVIDILTKQGYTFVTVDELLID